MSTSTKNDRSVTFAGGAIQIAFTWHGDRYLNTIRSRVLAVELASCEYAEIASPVFTDLHQQGGVVFLSGMADGLQWSMSVAEVAAGVEFDVACRVRNKVMRLGTAYRCTGGVPKELASVRATIESHDDRLLIVAAELPSEIPGTVHYQYRVVTQT